MYMFWQATIPNRPMHFPHFVVIAKFAFSSVCKKVKKGKRKEGNAIPVTCRGGP
jgi:hypothetical protein